MMNSNEGKTGTDRVIETYVLSLLNVAVQDADIQDEPSRNTEEPVHELAENIQVDSIDSETKEVSDISVVSRPTPESAVAFSPSPVTSSELLPFKEPEPPKVLLDFPELDDVTGEEIHDVDFSEALASLANTQQAADTITESVSESVNESIVQPLAGDRVDNDLSQTKTLSANDEKHAETGVEPEQNAKETIEVTPARKSSTEEKAAEATDMAQAHAERDEQHQVADPYDPEAAAREVYEPWPEYDRPAWAENAFECLLFEVHGLTLAVPLIQLGAIHQVREPLTELFGRPEWFLGLLPIHDRNLNIVDALAWVMPDQARENPEEELQYAISIEGTDWAIACHAIHQSIRVEPEQVKWRSSRSHNPWFAGTLRDRMCSVVDAHCLGRFFDRVDRNKPR